MTTKERCLEILKDNEFFQSAMEKGRMVCVTHNYEPWIVIDDHMFGNQYNAVNSKGDMERIYDSMLCYIFNDKRLKDFYVCSQGQGTYEECKAKIDEYRSHIRQCKNCDGNGKKCFYWSNTECISSDTATLYDDETDREIITKTTVYQYACSYTQRDYHPTKSNCTYDIEDEPKLCTESWKKDYFVQYPNGIPDQIPLWQFLIDHSDQFDIVPRRWSNEASLERGFEKAKLFGSYKFYADYYSRCFVLENNRQSFYFRYDLANGVFIIGRPHRDIGYNVKRKFTESKYNYTLHKHVDQPIACWDKFSKWWGQLINEFILQTM